MSRCFRFKYVVGLYRDSMGNRQLEAVLFSAAMTHKEISDGLFGFKRRIVGAGFVELGKASDYPCEVIISGESESLGISPSPLDDFYVKRALGFYPAAEWDVKPEFRARLQKDYETACELIRTRDEK